MRVRKVYYSVGFTFFSVIFNCCIKVIYKVVILNALRFICQNSLCKFLVAIHGISWPCAPAKHLVANAIFGQDVFSEHINKHFEHHAYHIRAYLFWLVSQLILFADINCQVGNFVS